MSYNGSLQREGDMAVFLGGREVTGGGSSGSQLVMADLSSSYSLSAFYRSGPSSAFRKIKNQIVIHLWQIQSLDRHYLFIEEPNSKQ